MHVPEDIAEERKKSMEFIDELGNLVNKYRTEVSSGHLIGAMEVVKLRVFTEADEKFRKQTKEHGLESFSE
jgi:predicted DNA-binding protein with PD1-like motif